MAPLQINHSKPLISIVTIVFNGEREIEKTIKSVVQQSYGNFEYIVVDGGSSDQTLEIASKYASQISSLVSEPDKGISDAFNKGVRNSTGKWILFLNSGDTFFSPATLQTIAPFLETHNDADVIFGSCQVVTPEGIKLLTAGKPFSWSVFKRRMTISHQAAFHNAEFFFQYGLFRLDFRFGMDYELLLRKKDLNALYVSLPISQMLAGGQSQNHAWGVAAEFFRAQRLHRVFSRRIALGIFLRNFLVFSLCGRKLRQQTTNRYQPEK